MTQTPKKPTFQEAMGIDRQGVKKGSRFVPLAVLVGVVVVFVAWKFPGPEIDISEVATDHEAVNAEPNQFFIVKVKDSQTIYFRYFADDASEQRSPTAQEIIDLAIKNVGDAQKKLDESLDNGRDPETSSGAPDTELEELTAELKGLTESLDNDTEKFFACRAKIDEDLIPQLVSIQEKLQKKPGGRTDGSETQGVTDGGTGQLKREVGRLNKKLNALIEVSDPRISFARPDHVLELFRTATDLPTPNSTLLDDVSPFAKSVVNDFPILLLAQLKAISTPCLLALVPGIFGLVYRRSFWRYFLGSFLFLYWLYYLNRNEIEAIPGLELQWFTDPLIRFVEHMVFLWIVVSGLRRHSAGSTSLKRTVRTLLLAVACAAIAMGIIWSLPLSPKLFNVVFVLSIVSVGLVRQAWPRSEPKHGKNIVLCFDGTWNLPGTKDFGFLAETNVYKLFKMLRGNPSRQRANANQTKEYWGDSTSPKQIAFYYHGVGNRVENSQIGQLVGGAFGLGASAIVERAYLDVARVYRPGDRIFIFGFSRGAAIARLVAGTLGRRGIPDSMWTLRLFGRHWLVWASAKVPDDESADSAAAETAAVSSVKVDVLGVWDTVGAFGISKNIMGIPFQRINLLKNLDVSLCVKQAYHMVALDETRDSFEPTLMDPDPVQPARIIEVWFSGNHSNVGGGYADDQLSNVTLDFLLRQISSGYAYDATMRPGDKSWGLYLNAVHKEFESQGDPNDPPYVVDPNECGGLRHSTGAIYKHAPRKLPLHAVIHDSVFIRMRSSLPIYAPESVLRLNDRLCKLHERFKAGATRLHETQSIGDAEFVDIVEWSQGRMSVNKWENYLKLKVKDKTVASESGEINLSELLCPSSKLDNSAMQNARPTASVGKP